MDDAGQIRALSEVLHAQVGYLLGRAGIPVLHIKGPTVALWLYDEGERPWGDVDVLVAPRDADAAVEVLRRAGLDERFPGVNRHSSTDHAVTLAHRDPASGIVLSEVDVHERFEGIAADPDRVFDELWSRREPARLADVDVWFPDLITRGLLVVLNTARTPSLQARGDLSRLVASGGPEDWAAVIALARRVDALPALRVGLELDPAGPAVVSSTTLADVQVNREWELRRAGAPRTALRLEQLGRMSWPRRVSAIAHWLVPSPAIIRMRDPEASGNAAGLLLGYLRRLRDGLSSAGPSLRMLARLRRARGNDDG